MNDVIATWIVVNLAFPLHIRSCMQIMAVWSMSLA